MIIQRLKITIEGIRDGDLENGLEEVLRLVRAGCYSGFNSNETGAFHFQNTDEDKPDLAWTPHEESEEEEE